jgi:hypothetical protein
MTILKTILRKPNQGCGCGPVRIELGAISDGIG